ncbi:MAG: HigA family addiction module antidote protein [Thermomicrobiales bacterium]|nr:HigA family addiction module antidote protein [Thermomicrobiales bacterium]
MTARPLIHPGEVLREEIEFLSLTPAELARTLSVPPNRVSQILNGKRSISADTALRLGHWLGTGPELWLNLQRQYDLRVADNENGDEIRATVQPLQRDDATEQQPA